MNNSVLLRRKAKRVRLLPDVPEAMGILLLLGILVTLFSQLLGGYLDALAILLIVAACFLRDRVFRISAFIIIPSGLSAAYALIWMLSCTPVTCSSQVAQVGTVGWQFAIYLFLFAIVSAHGMIKITPKVIVVSILLFFFFLAATDQFTLLDSLAALGTQNFYQSYRFGSSNEINTINFSALMLATLVPFAFPRTPRDFLGFFAMLLIAIFIVATYSRGGLILFGILTAISAIFIWRLSALNSLVTVLLSFLIMAVLSEIGYFEKRAFNFETDASFEVRLLAFQLLGEIEFLGNKAALSEHLSRGWAIDNTIVRHFVGGGVSIILLFVAIGPAAARSFRSWLHRDLSTRAAIALFGWILAMLADDTFFSIWGAFLISLFIVPSTISRRRRHKTAMSPHPEHGVPSSQN